MLYRILKILLRLGMDLYYREIKVKNAHLLKHDGPLIIIANHPNTLIDAWMIGRACDQPIHYMAKGTFFNTKLKRWILGSLNMIPINRQVDGNTSGVNNQSSFEACYKVLEAGKSLVIFPEGNSIMERQLRDLKSGTARIALEVMKRNQGNLNLKIIPVGLFYSQAFRFRSSVFMNIGEGIGINEYLEEYNSNSSQAAKHLTARLRNMLLEVLVPSSSKAQEELLEDLCDIIYNGKKTDQVEIRADLMKKILVRIEEIQLMRPYLMEEIQELVNNFKWQTNQLDVRADFLERRFRSRMYLYELSLSLLFFLIGLPAFIFGFIHSFIPYKITDLIMPKLIRNIEYYAPVAILVGLILYPINYILFLNLADLVFELSPTSKVLYFLAMPVTGMYAHYFVKFLGSISFRLRFIFLIINKKEALLSLREKKHRLNGILFSDAEN